MGLKLLFEYKLAFSDDNRKISDFIAKLMNSQ